MKTAKYSVAKLVAAATTALAANTEALALVAAQEKINNGFIDTLTSELKIDKKTSLEKAAKINDLFVALAKEILPTKNPLTPIPVNGTIAVTSAVKEIEVTLPVPVAKDHTKRLKAIIRDLGMLSAEEVDTDTDVEFLLQEPEVFGVLATKNKVYKFTAPIPPVD
jgi:hypothetical protein